MLSVTDLSKVLLDHCSRADKMENSNLLLFCIETVCYLLAGGTTQKDIADKEANSPKHQWKS